MKFIDNKAIQSDLDNPPPLVPGVFLGGLKIAGLTIEACTSRSVWMGWEIYSKPFLAGLAVRRIKEGRIRQV